MYLSRLPLDTARRETLQALASPSMFHGAVESAFPGARQRNLWRLDQLDGRYYLLMLSADKPDLASAAAQFAPAGEAGQIKDYAPLLERVQNGTKWRFRLRANPTYSERGKPGERGRVCAHSTAEHQRKWLLRQSQQHGFTLEENAFDVTHSQWYHFMKGEKGGKISLLAVSYEGVLTVSDAQAFRTVLTEGMGREKAYGLGLMTLVRTEA